MKDHLSGMKDKPVSQDLENTIHDCLGQGYRLRKLPEKLEALYRKSDEAGRYRRFLIFGIVGIIFYNLFLIGDAIMLPDIIYQAFVTRIFIVTPLAIVSLIVMVIRKKGWILDFLAGNIMLAVSVSIMYFLLITENPNVSNYHTGLLIIIMFVNIIVRIRSEYAFIYSFLILFLYIFTAYNISLMNVETTNNSILVLFTTVCISLIGNLHIEKENRLNFLNTLLRQIDAQKLEVSNKTFERLSVSDALTGLPNRRHFDISLENEWRACGRIQRPVSLIFMDIDFFKLYNDNYGHPKGDWCLKQIADELHQISKRPRDLAARYGGEEFVVLLPDTEKQGAKMLAEQIRSAVETLVIPHDYSKIAGHVTITLGVATLVPTVGENDSEDLVKIADKALYEAKNSGRNKVCASTASAKNIG